MALLALLLLVLSACSDQRPGQPPVADSTFAEILVEMHLARGAATFDVPPPGIRDSILAGYGVDSSRWEQALVYYSEHPDAYLQRYNDVLDRLADERPR